MGKLLEKFIRKVLLKFLQNIYLKSLPKSTFFLIFRTIEFPSNFSYFIPKSVFSYLHFRWESNEIFKFPKTKLFFSYLHYHRRSNKISHLLKKHFFSYFHNHGRSKIFSRFQNAFFFLSPLQEGPTKFTSCPKKGEKHLFLKNEKFVGPSAVVKIRKKNSFVWRIKNSVGNLVILKLRVIKDFKWIFLKEFMKKILVRTSWILRLLELGFVWAAFISLASWYRKCHCSLNLWIDAKNGGKYFCGTFSPSRKHNKGVTICLRFLVRISYQNDMFSSTNKIFLYFCGP